MWNRTVLLQERIRAAIGLRRAKQTKATVVTVHYNLAPKCLVLTKVRKLLATRPQVYHG